MLPQEFHVKRLLGDASLDIPELGLPIAEDEVRRVLEESTTMTVNVCNMENEILINRHPQELWDIATRETSAWWRGDLREGSYGVSIEPFVGGRIWQRYDDSGSGILYGTVVALEPPNMIHFTSTISIFGVALSAYTWLFSECGEGTLVNVSVQLLSEYPERLMCGIVKRRIIILMDSLKQYATA